MSDIYMKNISESSHINKDRGIQTEKEKALTFALERGMGYLESRCQGSLYKEDFGLRHGDSIAWSTAYVARLLKEIEPEKIKGNESALLNLQNSDGGWGYNNLVPSDADSTANALLLLKDTLNKEKYDEAVKFIKSHQHANGGISTYTLDNLQKMGYKGEGWAMPHV